MFLSKKRLLFATKIDMVQSLAGTHEKTKRQHYVENRQCNVNCLRYVGINCCLRDCRARIVDGRFVHVLFLSNISQRITLNIKQTERTNFVLALRTDSKNVNPSFLSTITFLIEEINIRILMMFITIFIAIVGFSCTFRVSKGEKYNPMLKLNTSMVFREKERKYKNIFEVLFRRSVLGAAYKQTIIDKFESGVLKVFFRIYLDRRKIPRSITNVEDTIEDIIAKETYSSSSLFKDMELDLTAISVKSQHPLEIH
ncbi:hypothetical protein E2986_11858 [Frieseomelitta varia]|uniref:SEA domain-containing protein n=1 Tax=Frieseomelitta varia TaxID=561572 RepID=A0A833SBF2_9HYME|nr:hypothetical protein E2986_11858 [Frieseomelitta varia]